MRVCIILLLIAFFIPTSAIAEYWLTLRDSNLTSFDLASKGYEIKSATRSMRLLIEGGQTFEQGAEFIYLQKNNSIFMCPITLSGVIPTKSQFSCRELVAPYDMHAK